MFHFVIQIFLFLFGSYYALSIKNKNTEIMNDISIYWGGGGGGLTIYFSFHMAMFSFHKFYIEDL